MTELHRIVIRRRVAVFRNWAHCYETGPQACIDALEDYFVRNKDDRRFRVENPRRAAEEFLELLRGYSHLKMLLGIEKAPSARDIDARIDSAVRHVLV